MDRFPPLKSINCTTEGKTARMDPLPGAEVSRRMIKDWRRIQDEEMEAAGPIASETSQKRILYVSRRVDALQQLSAGKSMARTLSMLERLMKNGGAASDSCRPADSDVPHSDHVVHISSSNLGNNFSAASTSGQPYSGTALSPTKTRTLTGTVSSPLQKQRESHTNQVSRLDGVNARYLDGFGGVKRGWASPDRSGSAITASTPIKSRPHHPTQDLAVSPIQKSDGFVPGHSPQDTHRGSSRLEGSNEICDFENGCSSLLAPTDLMDNFAIRNLSPERSRMQKDPGRPLAESSELPSISKPNNLQSNQTNSFDVVGLLAPESVNRTANDAEDDLDSMIVKQEEESFEHFAPSSASQVLLIPERDFDMNEDSMDSNGEIVVRNQENLNTAAPPSAPAAGVSPPVFSDFDGCSSRSSATASLNPDRASSSTANTMNKQVPAPPKVRALNLAGAGGPSNKLERKLFRSIDSAFMCLREIKNQETYSGPWTDGPPEKIVEFFHLLKQAFSITTKEDVPVPVVENAASLRASELVLYNEFPPVMDTGQEGGLIPKAPSNTAVHQVHPNEICDNDVAVRSLPGNGIAGTSGNVSGTFDTLEVSPYKINDTQDRELGRNESFSAAGANPVKTGTLVKDLSIHGLIQATAAKAVPPPSKFDLALQRLIDPSVSIEEIDRIFINRSELFECLPEEASESQDAFTEEVLSDADSEEDEPLPVDTARALFAEVDEAIAIARINRRSSGSIDSTRVLRPRPSKETALIEDVLDVLLAADAASSDEDYDGHDDSDTNSNISDEKSALPRAPGENMLTEGRTETSDEEDSDGFDFADVEDFVELFLETSDVPKKKIGTEAGPSTSTQPSKADAPEEVCIKIEEISPVQTDTEDEEEESDSVMIVEEDSVVTDDQPDDEDLATITAVKSISKLIHEGCQITDDFISAQLKELFRSDPAEELMRRTAEATTRRKGTVKRNGTEVSRSAPQTARVTRPRRSAERRSPPPKKIKIQADDDFEAPCGSQRGSPRKRPIRVMDSDSEDNGGGDSPVVIPVSDASDQDDDSLADMPAITVPTKEVHTKKPSGLSEKIKRRLVRKVLDDADLCKNSRRAIEQERERQERLEALPEHGGSVLDRFQDDLGGTVDVEVWPDLWSLLRPHQQEGVKFIYRNVIESFDNYKNNDLGGCILAHSMGLGKTVQVLAFLQAVMMNDALDLKTCLVLCPASTVLNWDNECKEWMKHVPKPLRLKTHYIIDRHGQQMRLETMRKWKANGGILLLSYSMYTILCGDRPRQHGLPEERKEFLKLLQDPGPDLVVCDEAHELKNEKSQRSRVVNQIATLGRIALTGTPLQNNLDEYYTMVNFIKQSLLGSRPEFRNRYVIPISRGSDKEANPWEVTMMRKRTNILRETLSACLQLQGVAILTASLKPKTEHVIRVRMTQLQIDLYKAYIHKRGIEQTCDSTERLTAMKTVQLISLHPKCLQDNLVCETRKAQDILQKKKLKALEESDEEDAPDFLKDEKLWFEGILPELNGLDITLGTKAILVREIVVECRNRNDKVLIFSERRGVITFLGNLLEQLHQEKRRTPNGELIQMVRGRNYLELTGSTPIATRFELIQRFNKRPECCVFLLSIKAAGMGINLIGANRVILLEPMWNPTVDKQALFRAYRYGQTKPVHVYRLVTAGICEEKIHENQLNKQAMSQRVLEEKHRRRNGTIGRPDFFTYTESPYTKPFIPERPPEDVLLHLLTKFPELIVDIENWESLLEPNEPPLTFEESCLAWAEHEFEYESNKNNDILDVGGFDRSLLLNKLNAAKLFQFTLTFEDVQSLPALATAMSRSLKTRKRNRITFINQLIAVKPVLKQMVAELKLQWAKEHGPAGRPDLNGPVAAIHHHYGLDDMPSMSRDFARQPLPRVVVREPRDFESSHPSHGPRPEYHPYVPVRPAPNHIAGYPDAQPAPFRPLNPVPGTDTAGMRGAPSGSVGPPRRNDVSVASLMPAHKAQSSVPQVISTAAQKENV